MMASTQLAEYSGSPHHHTWLPTRSFRYSPYPSIAYTPSEPSSRNPMPPVQIPTPSPPHQHGRAYPVSEPERLANDMNNQMNHADTTIYIQGYPSSQAPATVFTSHLDVPAAPASQPVIIGSPLIHDVDVHERERCAKDESECAETPVSVQISSTSFIHHL